MNVHSLRNYRETQFQLFSIPHTFNIGDFVACIFENPLSLNIVESLIYTRTGCCTQP